MKLLFAWQAWLDRIPLWAVSMIGGIMLSSGWLHPLLTPVIFLAWQPFFTLKRRIVKGVAKKSTYFLYTYFMLLVWNLISTWWIWNSTIGGMIAANVCNALLMYLPLWYYRKFPTTKIGNLNFDNIISAWLLFEYVHMQWDLSWSWLNLGNVFAFTHHWVQWYSITGVLGGTLWVLIINLLIKNLVNKGTTWSRYWQLAAFWVLPIIGSMVYFYARDPHQGTAAEVVVVQPNVDPYKEKFATSETAIPANEQINRFIGLSEAKITDSTVWVLWPETCLPDLIDEANAEIDPQIQQIRTFVNKYPHIKLLTGSTTYLLYPEKQTRTARFKEGVGYFDIFNTGLLFQAGKKVEVYHKSKLVPGVEQLPYPEFFGLLGSLAIDLGGTAGGLGSQPNRAALGEMPNRMAPIICYESVYGGFCSGFMTDNAQVIGIITNDGWWGNTPGHQHHLAYARLRAIESGKSIARSANTGISAFLNQRGDIEQQLGWWQKGALVGKVYLNSNRTIYSYFNEQWLAYALTVYLLIAFALNKWGYR